MASYGSDFCYGDSALIPASFARIFGALLSLTDRSYPRIANSPRIDQGERLYHFWLKGGPLDERLAAIDREALVHNEKTHGAILLPGGGDEPQPPFITLTGDVVQLELSRERIRERV